MTQFKALGIALVPCSNCRTTSSLHVCGPTAGLQYVRCWWCMEYGQSRVGLVQVAEVWNEEQTLRGITRALEGRLAEEYRGYG